MMTKEQVLNMVEELQGLRMEVWANREREESTLTEEEVTKKARYDELYDLLLTDEARVFKCEACGEMVGWYDLASEDNEHLCINCA